MKKTFAIILIALMAMTAVFADSTNIVSATKIASQHSDLTVKLTINPAQMHLQNIKFLGIVY